MCSESMPTNHHGLIQRDFFESNRNDLSAKFQSKIIYDYLKDFIFHVIITMLKGIVLYRVFAIECYRFNLVTEPGEQILIQSLEIIIIKQSEIGYLLYPKQTVEVNRL